LSHDEIVFDEVRYREPERRCRPDRDRRWACLAYETPDPIDLPIFLDRVTADAIERHALCDTSVELGGILLGKECLDERTGLPFVLVTKSLEAKHYENTQASFTYTHDSWEEITRERERLHPDLDIVGWYHTHPDFGIFLSSHDQFIHRHFFAQPLQVAYVVDPVRQTRGFFQWRDGALEEVGGYFLIADRADRVALARMVNDLENLPNADSGGGGLSPRLEAQLIAMLTRPVTPSQSTVERTQSALLFSLLGSLAGMLAVIAGLFLFQMYREVSGQSESIRQLEQNTTELLSAQRLAMDQLLDEASQGHSEKFTERYNAMARERDQYRKELERAKTVDAALIDRSRTLEVNHQKLATELAAAQKIVDQYNAEKKDSPTLLKRLALVEDELKSQSEIIRQKDRVLETVKDAKLTETLLNNYDRAWYAAIVGWGLFLVATLGVFTLLGQARLSTPRAADESVDEPPPHRIV